MNPPELLRMPGMDIIEAVPGTYALLLLSERAEAMAIGLLGNLRLQPGYYVYVGSALGPGGLRARLAHHTRPAERPRWHIDYLRAFANLEQVWFCYDRSRREHSWARRIGSEPGASVPIAGFGASDCDCDSHLFFFEQRPRLTWLNEQNIASVHLYSPGNRR